MNSAVHINKKTLRMRKQLRSRAVAEIADRTACGALITSITILSHARSNINKIVTSSRKRDTI